jgi:hypothetical protein
MRSFLDWRVRFFSLVALLLLLALACDLPSASNGDSQETKIIEAVQLTLVSDQAATVQVQQTQLANLSTQAAEDGQDPTPTPEAAADTPLVPTQTPEAQVTDTSPPPTVAPTATASATEPFFLVEWGLNGFLLRTSGCYDSNSSCWVQERTSQSSSMVVTQPILISNSWRQPYLVYRHKYTMPEVCRGSLGGVCGKVTGFLAATSGGSTIVMRRYENSSGWSIERVPIDMFVGKEVEFKFYTQVDEPRYLGTVTSYWYLQEIQIQPVLQP